jgi:hypothetical protein
MMVSADPIQAFLEGLSGDARSVVLALRALVRETVPDAEETVLWGGLSYHCPWVGGRVKGAICQITAKNGRVRLEFIHGIRLSDPQHLLRGSRLSKRYVDILSPAEADRARIRALILDASSVGFGP